MLGLNLKLIGQSDLVMATLIRRQSLKRCPTISGPSAPFSDEGSIFTVERIITSMSRPWNLSTVLTSTSRKKPSSGRGTNHKLKKVEFKLNNRNVLKKNQRENVEQDMMQNIPSNNTNNTAIKL